MIDIDFLIHMHDLRVRIFEGLFDHRENISVNAQIYSAFFARSQKGKETTSSGPAIKQQVNS